MIEPQSLSWKDKHSPSDHRWEFASVSLRVVICDSHSKTILEIDTVKKKKVPDILFEWGTCKGDGPHIG